MTQPTLTMTLTLIGEFGDVTTVTKTLDDGTGIKHVWRAICEALLACGYTPETVAEWFGKEGE